MTSLNTTQLSTQLSSQTSSVQLIYAGGTFGSYGTPLAPLAPSQLLPNLLKQLADQGVIPTDDAISVLDNPCVKDSSALSPADFVHFYQLILSQYQQGKRQFVLITGTDTLSYLGAFLAEAFVGSDICIALTASMKPLFDAQISDEFVIDKNSDAWGNITQAIQVASKTFNQGKSGVFTCLSGDTWHSQSVQKIDSHALLAFTGQIESPVYPASSYVNKLSDEQKSNWLAKHAKFKPLIDSQLPTVQLPVIYAVPNDEAFLAKQVAFSLEDSQPSATIIMGFGAGNIPHSQPLATLFEQKAKAGHLIVATTQCPFGGVSDAYAAGSWQYEHQVLSGGKLTVPAIYARLLWLLLTTEVANRREKWTALA